MAVRILRRGHGFALVDVNGVHNLAVAVDYIVLACLGAGITAIKLHNYLRKSNMRSAETFYSKILRGGSPHAHACGDHADNEAYVEHDDYHF